MQSTTSVRPTPPLVPILLAGLFASTVAVGCASSGGSKSVEWPTADVVPSEGPDELETEAPGSMLRRGSDGFFYAVGGLPDGAEPGTPFFARYSGDWPLKETPRPPWPPGGSSENSPKIPRSSTCRIACRRPTSRIWS